MTRRSRIITRAAHSAGLALILIGFAAAPAVAAPALEVQIEHHEAVVSHSDERLDYTVKIKNTAPAGVPTVAGDVLTCVPNVWEAAGASGPMVFAYQWLRNGEEIGGATTDSYTTSVADEGKVVQCQIRVTNSDPDVNNQNDFVGRIASVQGIIVTPQPVTAPPTPPNFLGTPEQSGPLDGSATQELTCNAGSWGGVPTSYTYRWFRNGLPYGAPTVETAAISAKVAVPAGDQTPPTTFQCTVTATNAGGSVSKSSPSRITVPAPFPGEPENAGVDGPEAAFRPSVSTANYTKAPLTVVLELPGGNETFAYEAGGSQWSCNKVPAFGGQPAKAVCESSQSVPPGGVSFSPLTVVAAIGGDAPDLAVARATAFGGGIPAPVSAVDEFTFEPFREFGLIPGTFEAALLDCAGSSLPLQAGGHPCKGVGNFELTTKRTLTAAAGGTKGDEAVPIEHVKQIITDLPRGQVGNALAVPELCGGVDVIFAGKCPPESAVGIINIVVRGAPSVPTPIYSIEPEFGTPAEFAFEEPLANIFTLSARLRPEDGYAISLEASPPPKIDFEKAKATICNFGVDLSGGVFGADCKQPGEPGSNPKPLFTNPTRCGSPPARARLRSWEHPDVEKVFSFTGPEIIGCDQVKFEPDMGLQPTSHQADSSTGLDVNLTMPTDGLESQTGVSQANLKQARITFPEGMSVNPSAGRGLGACSAEQVKLKTNDPIECPDSSKIGTVEIDTPVIQETLKGDVYVAKQGEVDGALIGFYLVFDSKKDGVLVKVPARVDPQPNGQLVVTVDESPEQPFSAVRMHFPGGSRAALVNPPQCGTYGIKAELTPWSAADPNNPTPAETVTQTSSFNVTEGPDGAPCPDNKLDPKLRAGLKDTQAGSKSPFVLEVSREDGSQRFSGLEVKMPPGLTAYLKGVPYCSDAVLAGISGAEETGRPQLANPSCPAASEVGTVEAGAGAGPFPFYAPGKAYLAGPYKGAPISIAIVTPAVAGPFDLGNVVVRNALYIDPESAQVTVKSDPIPTILHGLLLDVKDIRVDIDRQDFTAAPTNCEAMSVGATVTGEQGATADLSNRFQVGACDKLAFKPSLALRLKGGTHRGDHPALRATLSYPPGPGYANIKSAVVALPHSEFLEQAHIKTICTRVQFAAQACPKGSIYGHAEATTPLLDSPLSGPVYLRSSANPLPDLVVALRGPDSQPIEVVLDGRIDSVKGGIRSSFDVVPDQPVSKFTLSMQGGKKGLLVNSRNLCAKASHATAEFSAQNGKALTLHPKLQSACGKAKAKKPKRHHGR